jgi:hypothetical protein
VNDPSRPFRSSTHQRRDAGRHPSGSYQGCSGHTSAQPSSCFVQDVVHSEHFRVVTLYRRPLHSSRSRPDLHLLSRYQIQAADDQHPVRRRPDCRERPQNGQHHSKWRQPARLPASELQHRPADRYRCLEGNGVPVRRHQSVRPDLSDSHRPRAWRLCSTIRPSSHTLGRIDAAFLTRLRPSRNRRDLRFALCTTTTGRVARRLTLTSMPDGR